MKEQIESINSRLMSLQVEVLALRATVPLVHEYTHIYLRSLEGLLSSATRDSKEALKWAEKECPALITDSRDVPASKSSDDLPF